MSIPEVFPENLSPNQRGWPSELRIPAFFSSRIHTPQPFRNSGDRAGRQSNLYDIARRVEPLRQERDSDFRNSGPNVDESWSKADDEIWEELREEFIELRFSRSELHRCRRVLMTYIKIKNEEVGDQARSSPRRGRPSPGEGHGNRTSRGTQEESRGRTSRRARSSRRQGSRWSSSFETLIDDQGYPSRSR